MQYFWQGIKIMMMKKTTLIFLALLLTGSIFSQTNPSGKIKKAFNKQYPEAVNTKWTSEGERQTREWRAMYKQNNVLHASWYDYKGNWLQTKTKIDEKELPDAVLKTIEEEYAGYKIMITTRFENPETNGYEVFLDNETYGFAVQFSKDGEIIKRKLSSKGYRPIDDDGNVIEE